MACINCLPVCPAFPPSLSFSPSLYIIWMYVIQLHINALYLSCERAAQTYWRRMYVWKQAVTFPGLGPKNRNASTSLSLYIYVYVVVSLSLSLFTSTHKISFTHSLSCLFSFSERRFCSLQQSCLGFSHLFIPPDTYAHTHTHTHTHPTTLLFLYRLLCLNLCPSVVCRLFSRDPPLQRNVFSTQTGLMSSSADLLYRL